MASSGWPVVDVYKRQARVGRGGVGFFQREFHVARHGPGHEQHVGVTRRGDEVDAEAFEIIDRAVEAVDFDFAAVARAGIHFADVERAAEHGLDCLLYTSPLRAPGQE